MKHYLFAFLTMIALSANAQDVIVKRNGDEIQAKVAKVSDSEIEYKKWSNQNGPSYTMKTNDVFMIKYENGEKDVFGDNSEAKEKETQPNVLMENVSLPSDEQLALINSYKTVLGFRDGADELKGGKAKAAVYQLEIAENSVVADKNVEFIFLNTCKSCPFINVRYGLDYGMDVLVKNKTDKTIYLDLANSFFVRDSKPEPYYEQKVYSQSHTTGVSVNTGIGAFSFNGATGNTIGMGVGRSSSYTSQVITFSQRVVAIPPMTVQSLGIKLYFTKEMCAVSGVGSKKGMAQLMNQKSVTVRGGGQTGTGTLQIDSFQESPSVGTCPVLKDQKLSLGDTQQFSEENSPMTFGVFLTYSDSEQLTTTNTLKTSFFVNRVIPVKKHPAILITHKVPNLERLECLSGNLDNSLFFACPFK